jgi:hypothetical protein
MTFRVLAVSGDTVTLCREENAGCFGCMKRECNETKRHITAKNPLGIPVAVGQVAEVETPLSGVIAQGLQAVLPLIGGFAGAFMLAGLLLPRSGDPFRAAVGALGLFAAGLLTYWVRTRFPAAITSRITRRLRRF